MSRRAWVVLAGLGLAPVSAGAHSDSARFAEPAELGGSAGRYFTGSPEDGLGCSVCHRGGAPPRVTVDGLPSVLEPGTPHTVRVAWEDPSESHALVLELVDAEGRHPEVELVDAEDPPAQTRCEGDPNGSPAAWTVDLQSRRVIGVLDCGASEVSLAFVAPDAPELYFAAAIVRSDSSATAEGDGVLELRRTISSAVQGGSGCAVVRTHGGASTLLGLLVLALAAPPRRLRGTRRRTSR